MKIISAIIFLSVFVNATDYFAKLEPLETYNIKSAVSGQVIFTNDNIEGSISHNSIIVTIDSEIDKIDFKQTTNKLKTLTKIITIEKSTLKKFKNIRSKSQLDKDNQQIKILNLENQQSDMIVKLASLKDKISKKELKEKNYYISNINVQVGDFVNPGSLLYTASNISKSKLEIFLPINST
ncbi:MAG: HlyD family secretion protein, partial [Epsilonproteobacteria bacterium]